MFVEVELIKNEEAFSEKDIKEIAEGQEKIIKKQDELIDYMLSLLQCWWMRATLMSVPKGGRRTANNSLILLIKTNVLRIIWNYCEGDGGMRNE